MTPLPPSSTLFPYTTLFRSGRGDFQHAIAILGGQPVLVDAFGEVEAALERAVGNLSVVVICLLGFADVAAFAANRQSVALYLDVDILGFHARQHHMAVEFLVIFIDKGFDSGRESRDERALLLSRGPTQEAVEDLVKIPSEIEQILKQAVSWN